MPPSRRDLLNTKKGFIVHKAVMEVVTVKDILAARELIQRFIKLTPVLTCSEANRIAKRNIYFKAEHLQTTGAFKIRGATNAVMKIKSKYGLDHPGVVTHSSGNHGQALACAANVAGLPCTIVVPKGSPSCKVEAIKGYGAKLVECFPSPTARVETMEKVCKETGQVFVSPYDHADVIAGQGTIGLELVEQIPDLDAVLVAISGGGLASGIAMAVKSVRPECKVYAVTPKGKMLEDCLRAGERLWPNPPQFLDTIADAIKLQQTGFNTFTLLKELAEKNVFEMSDEEMIEGMRFSFHRMKQVIEAAAGAAVAAALSDKMASLPAEIKNVAVILCGGNADIDNFPWYDSFKKAY
ncbi:serine racemase-like [Watersipora subatra]|uniref:serine racemase-like n=1 Tax=Watersipora subatra TaxID=2589382 RepID=UPI00355B2465